MWLSISSVQNSLSKEFEVDLRGYLWMVLFENSDADFCLFLGGLPPKLLKKLLAIFFKSEILDAGVVGAFISSWSSCKSVGKS